MIPAHIIIPGEKHTVGIYLFQKRLILLFFIIHKKAQFYELHKWTAVSMKANIWSNIKKWNLCTSSWAIDLNHTCKGLVKHLPDKTVLPVKHNSHQELDRNVCTVCKMGKILQLFYSKARVWGRIFKSCVSDLWCHVLCLRLTLHASTGTFTWLSTTLMLRGEKWVEKHVERKREKQRETSVLVICHNQYNGFCACS